MEPRHLSEHIIFAKSLVDGAHFTWTCSRHLVNWPPANSVPDQRVAPDFRVAGFPDTRNKW
jgi:hypothetical protein